MENIKYAEFTGKVVEVDRKLDAVITEVYNTIREAVKDMPMSEMADWAKLARDDDRVSPQIYHLVLMMARGEIDKRVADILRAVNRM